MSWSRWIQKSVYSAYSSTAYVCKGAYSYFDDYMVSPVTPIVKAIYNSWPVSNVRSGFGKVLNVPEILNLSDQTKKILVRSVSTNFFNYFLPVMIYRRSITYALDRAPDVIDPYIVAFDWVVTLTLVARLFGRRLVDNTMYMTCLPRAVSNDMRAHLVKQISELLSEKCWPGLKETFLKNAGQVDVHKERLKQDLKKVFDVFFSQPNLTDDSFQSLIKPLRDVFVYIINVASQNEGQNLVSDFSSELARAIANELSIVFSQAFIERVTTEKKDFDTALSADFMLKVADEKCDDFSKAIQQRRLEDKGRLVRVLNCGFVPHRVEKYTNELLQIIVETRAKVQPFFPIKYVKACDHSIKKNAMGEVADPAHRAMIMLVLKFINSLPSMFVMNEYFYYGLTWATYMIGILNIGQGVDVYKIAAAWQCTTHRYEKFDKPHSFGVGLSHVMITEVIERVLAAVTGVDCFFTRDAIQNVVMQCVVIASLASNKPVPGQTKPSPEILFWFPRYLTNFFGQQIRHIFVSEISDVKQREKSFEKIKDGLGSPVLHNSLRLLLEGHDFYPSQDVLEESSVIFKAKYKEFVRPFEKKKKGNVDEKHIIPVCKVDPIDLMFDYPSVHFLFRMFREDILKVLSTVDNARLWSLWLEKMMVPLPVLNFVSSFFHFPLLLLKDESFARVSSAFRSHIKAVPDVSESDVKPKEFQVVHFSEVKMEEIKEAHFSRASASGPQLLSGISEEKPILHHPSAVLHALHSVLDDSITLPQTFHENASVLSFEIIEDYQFVSDPIPDPDLIPDSKLEVPVTVARASRVEAKSNDVTPVSLLGLFADPSLMVERNRPRNQGMTESPGLEMKQF